MTTALIFDMDGTLFQTNLILEPALEATFEKLRMKKLWNEKTPIDQYRKIMGVPLPVVWKTLCPQHTLEVHKNTNQWFLDELIQQITKGNGALYEGAEETLAHLSKKYPIYIASNGQIPYLQAIVDQFRLNRFIKGVYSIELIQSGNKSELVHLVKSENGIEEGFVIGDRSSDIKAALDNNLTSIGVRFDFAQENELNNANFVIDHFKGILTIV